MLNVHKEKGADLTVAVLNVSLKEASRFGIMNTEEGGKIVEFEEKPAEPKSNLASMGIYIFNWDILKKYLIEDEADPNSSNDFGNNIIPNLLKDGRNMYAYHFSGYWKDVGTISSLWEANMEILDPEHSGINLFDNDWKIYSRNRCCGKLYDHRWLPYCRSCQTFDSVLRCKGCRGRRSRRCRYHGRNRDRIRSSRETLYRCGKRCDWPECRGRRNAA